MRRYYLLTVLIGLCQLVSGGDSITLKKPSVITPSNLVAGVGQYEKLELAISLPVMVNKAVSEFVNKTGQSGINPFDPNQIDVVVTFKSVDGNSERTVYGFYYREFRRELTTSDRWLNTKTSLPWRIRFAPDVIGKWTCSISVTVPSLGLKIERDDYFGFTCIKSSNPGYLQVGRDGKHLKFSDSSSFFAIGQNIAWPLELAENWETGRVSTKTFANHKNAVQNLVDNDGNYFRLAMAPWGHAFEWEELGNYYGRMAQAWEFDRIIEIAESGDAYIHLCLEMNVGYNATAPGSKPSVWSWENNPYNSASPGNGGAYSDVLKPADILTSPNARAYFQRRLRYVIARWGYSTSLGVIEFLNELDHWDEFKKSDEMQKASVGWHQSMFNYILDSLNHRTHLVSTSYGGNPHNYVVSGRKGQSHPFDFLSITSIHKYRSLKDASFVNFNVMQSKKNGMVRGAWRDKPAILGEIGMQAAAAQTRQASNKADVGDIEKCDDISFHNSIWSSAFMGGYGVGLNWWQDHNDGHRKSNFPQLAAFFKDIDFEKTLFAKSQSWKDSHFNSNFKNECEEIGNLDNTREVFALVSENKRMAIGWVHNATYYWGNLKAMKECQDRNKRVMELPCDDDKFSEPISIKGEKITITGLKPRRMYTLEWYTTGTYGMLDSLEIRTGLYGTLKPRYPSDSEPDLAFKIKLSP